MLYKLCTFS